MRAQERPLLSLLLLATASLATCLLGSCGSTAPTGRSLGGPPRGLDGFPAQVLTEDILVEASYDPSRFGPTMLRKGIFPVELHARIAGRSDRRVLLESERLDLHLILQDGTVLPAMRVDDVIQRYSRSFADKIRKLAYDPSLLTPSSRPGFVYFDLTVAGKHEISGLRMTVGREGIVRNNDLKESLLVFTAVVDGTPQAFHVGIPN